MGHFSQKIRLYISTAIIFLIIAASFSIIFYGVYQVYYAPATLFSSVFNEQKSVEEIFEERVINVAVLGLHNREEDNTFGEVYYVDTVIVASINFDHNALNLLAIPRDAYVQIYDSEKWDRIRQSYSYGFEANSAKGHQGGLNYTIETIDSLLGGREIHYYIAMDIEGLKKLIDSMGGVYYNVEKPMISFTPQESLDAGPQILDGQGFINYIIYREPDARDDLNRIRRQKSLLLATFRYFKDMGLFSYILPTYTVYRDHIDTNLNFNQVAALSIFAAERLEEDSIGDYSLHGEYVLIGKGEGYYLIIDEQQKEDILDIVFGGQGS